MKQRDTPALIVDAGDVFFDSIRPKKYKLDQIKTKAEGIVEAYNLIGYDAVGIASQDLAGGLDFLSGMIASSNFTWLSCNLVAKRTGLPISKSYITKEFGTFRVAVVGVTSTKIKELLLLEETVDILDWEDVLISLMPGIQKDHDFIIILTDLAPDDCAAISRRYPEVNLIIRAGGQAENHPPQKISSSTLITSTGRQGKYVGALDIEWIHNGNWQKESEEYKQLKEKEKDLQRTMAQLDQIKDKPGMGSRVGNLERKQEVLADEVNSLGAEIAEKKFSFYINRFYEMSEKTGEDPEVHKVVINIRQKIEDLTKKGTVLAAASDIGVPRGYLGWNRCLECHPEAVAKWESTRHAGSYVTLQKKNRQNDLDCLPCHVTGIDFNNVPSVLSLPDDMKVIGCEVCHGPGQEHVEGGGKVETMRVSAVVCVRCHVPEHDDNHNFARDVKKVACKKL